MWPQPLQKLINNLIFIAMKKITEYGKKKYMGLYTKSKPFKNPANSLGIGIGLSSFYGLTGGTCLCWGKGTRHVKLDSFIRYLTFFNFK